MSFTLYLLIQIPLITTLVCLVIYQHRLYSKQKKLVKEMIERDMYGLDDEKSYRNWDNDEIKIKEDE